MEKQHKFSIWYVLLGVWIVLIIQNLIVSMLGIKTIPYSEFLRLDRNILVDRPDKDGRAAILKVHLKNIKTEGHLDVEVLAGMTSGMVGADLANLVNEAALLAVRRNKKKVGMPEFEEAVERVVAGLEKKNRRIIPPAPTTIWPGPRILPAAWLRNMA